MKNKISDLNNYLFEQIELLNDESLTGDKLKETLQKSDAINKLSQTIINNASLQLQAAKTCAEQGIINRKQIVHLLGGAEDNEKQK